MMLGHVKNRQPVLFHSHPGQRVQHLYRNLAEDMELWKKNKKKTSADITGYICEQLGINIWKIFFDDFVTGDRHVAQNRK